MFVEHKEEGEVQQAPAKVLKLSEAIRIGKPLVNESSISHRFCALGCAWAGYKGREMTISDLTALHKNGGWSWGKRFEIALGIPEAIAKDISLMHSGGTPALKIADWLEEQGL